MKEYDIREYGARHGELSTAAIQSAIEACAADGGGTVTVANGTYITGTLFMRSNVHLRIEGGATLLMSDNIEHFPDFSCEWDTREAPRFSARCLIYIGNCESCALEGLGTIDCNGQAFCMENPSPAHSDTDPFLCRRMARKHAVADSVGRMIFVMKSKNITVSDLTVTEMAGGWGIWINACESVNLCRLKLHCCPDYPNSDGIHINCSRDVFISDCAVHSGDDALIVRANTNTLGEDIPCENVVVRGCTLSSHCQAIRIGWFGDGAIRNCLFSDIIITDSRDGITLELPREASPGDIGKNTTRIEQLSFQNIIIDRTYRYPVRITVAETASCDYIRAITFRNLTARTGFFPQLIGRPDAYLEDISFRDCRFTVKDHAANGFAPRYTRNLLTECVWQID